MGKILQLFFDFIEQLIWTTGEFEDHHCTAQLHHLRKIFILSFSEQETLLIPIVATYIGLLGLFKVGQY